MCYTYDNKFMMNLTRFASLLCIIAATSSCTDTTVESEPEVICLWGSQKFARYYQLRKQAASNEKQQDNESEECVA